MSSGLSITALQQRLHKLLNDRFLRNIGWLGSAQLANRVLRLCATIIVARLLLPEDYGLAALVLASHEFIQMFCRQGTGPRLVQARDDELPQLAQTAYWLNWIQCGGLFLLQCLIALPVSWAYGKPELALPLIVMGLSYLMLPPALVHTALNIRAQRLHVIAAAETLQTLADMLLTLVLVLSGWGFWALILPKVLVVPVWAFINRRAQDWRPGSFTLQHWRAIVGFSLQLTGVEILATLRNNLDYLLVGYFLGVEALGVYFFAFNAGLGISLGLISACSNALFPHLCDANHDAAELRQRFTRGLRTIALIAVPLVLLQASAAPFYLPLVFGQHWVDANALPILILICLSALPRPFAEAASQLLRALGQPRLDLFANAAFTVLLTIALLIGVQWGSIGVAAAVLLTHWLIQPLFTLWVWRHFLNNPDLHPSSVTPLTAKGVAHA